MHGQTDKNAESVVKELRSSKLFSSCVFKDTDIELQLLMLSTETINWIVALNENADSTNAVQ